MSAVTRIEQFLADNPNGDLWVAVAYATPAGIAWLHGRTLNRRVSLLIGDTRFRYWENVSATDKQTTVRFLQREDTNTKNWYRTHKSHKGAASVHLKAWVVVENGMPTAALAGSANLTRKGLDDDNVELMVAATGVDLDRCWEEMRNLHDVGWDCEERLLGYLGTGEQPSPSNSKTAKQPAHSDASPQPQTPAPVKKTPGRPAPAALKSKRIPAPPPPRSAPTITKSRSFLSRTIDKVWKRQ